MRCPTLEPEFEQQSMPGGEGAVLIASSFEEDHIRLCQILGGTERTVHSVSSCHEARAQMREEPPAVVICERDLLDGNWKDILHASKLLEHPPLVIVTSLLGDRNLFTETRNLGGYALLDRPLKEKEVLTVVNSAWRTWERQRLETTQGLMESRKQRLVQRPASGNGAREIFSGGRSKHMFENLDTQIHRIQENPPSNWSRVLQVSGVLSGVLLMTFLLFWGLHIGILLGD